MKSFDLKLKKGSSNSKIFTIRNGGGGILEIHSIKSETDKKKGWLKISKSASSLSVAHGCKEDVEFSIETKGLPYGYEDKGRITIASNGGSGSIDVNLSIKKRPFPVPIIVLLAILAIAGIVFGVLQTVDRTAPAGSISINNGDSCTNSRTIMLTISARDNVGIIGYHISEKSVPPEVSADIWTLVPPKKIFIKKDSYIIADDNDGTKTVYVWYKDSAWNISSLASDSIILDTTSPTVTISSPTSDATFTTTSEIIEIVGSASDSISKVSKVQWINSKGKPYEVKGTEKWSAKIKLVPGKNLITVTAVDVAGNTGTDTITIFKGDDIKAHGNSRDTNQDRNYTSIKTLGMTVKNPTAREVNNGIIVTEIKKGSPVDKAGIVLGDIIEEIDRQKVTNLNKFVELINSRVESKDVLVYVKRDVRQYIVIKDTSLQNFSQKNVPTVKIVMEENDKPTEVMISLPVGFRKLKIGDVGRVYFIDDDKTESIIADVKVSDIFETSNRMLAKVLSHSATISIEEGYFVKFQGNDVLQIKTDSYLFSVENHLMTGITKEEFHNAYKECATPPQKYIFLYTDRCATQWFSYQNAKPGDTITWKWYKPDGYLYYEDKGVVDNVEGCWISDLDIVYNVSYYPGQWQVKVYRNEDLLFSETFTISKPPPALAQFSVVKHLMTGISQDEFHGKYSGCVTPPQKDSFLETDLSATQWFYYQNATSGDIITWKWYAPGEYLYYEDKGTVDTGEGCWGSYLGISGRYASSNTGQWQVEVYRNGEFLFSETFTISKPKLVEVPVQPEKKVSKADGLHRCVTCSEEVGEGHICGITTYCQRCKEEVGPGHVCELTFFCHDCKKEVGDGHICGVTTFCLKCEEEVGTSHICDVTYFCYDCEKEVGDGHICGVTHFCLTCKAEVGEEHDCGNTFFCFDCEKEVIREHSH